MKVVANEVSLPFADHRTKLSLCGLLSNPEPMTVNVRSGLPAMTLEGEIELMENADEVALTLKSTEFDFEGGKDAIGSPVITNTWAVIGLANRAAGMTAVS